MSLAEVIDFPPMNDVANPQVENGFTRIANELFDAVLCADLTGNQKLVLLTIIRKTYGFNKKRDRISASQIGKALSMARTHANKALNELAEMNVILRDTDGGTATIEVQKDYKKWEKHTDYLTRTKNVTLGRKPLQGVTKTVTEGVTKNVHTKDNVKDINKKKKRANNQIALSTFLSRCKESGERPVRDYQPLWNFADSVGLPEDFIALAWAEFVRRFSKDGTHASKRYADWRKAFRNYVENNYLGLWWLNESNEYQLTAKGRQAEIAASGGAQ